MVWCYAPGSSIIPQISSSTITPLNGVFVLLFVSIPMYRGGRLVAVYSTGTISSQPMTLPTFLRGELRRIHILARSCAYHLFFLYKQSTSTSITLSFSHLSHSHLSDPLTPTPSLHPHTSHTERPGWAQRTASTSDTSASSQAAPPQQPGQKHQAARTAP